MTLALPTGWSTTEFNDYFAGLKAVADDVYNRSIFEPMPPYLQTHAAAMYAGTAIPSLPTGWSTTEFNDFYNSFATVATAHWNKAFLSRTQPYIVANVQEAMAGTAPPGASNYNFNFMTGNMPAGAALTRASTGWCFDGTPALVSRANDIARFQHDTSVGLTTGLLNEAASTNQIANSSGTGAAAGTPGTNPTGWTVATTGQGLTKSIVGTGIEDGIPYVDIRWAGTSTGTGQVGPQPTSNTAIAALQGQTWTGSMYCKLAAGSMANISSMFLQLSERTSAGANNGNSTTVIFTPTNAALKSQRITQSYTTVAATTAAIIEFCSFTPSAVGVAIDVTFRFGIFALEQAAAPPSTPIPTTAGAITRAADQLVLTLVAANYNVAITRLSGVTQLGKTTISGTYTVPNDPSPVQAVTFQLVN